MNFLSNLANSVPGVGHIKGLYHYAIGETKEGDEAMYQSTRSTVVIVGGIAGGPAGAMAFGLITDVTSSALTGEEKGLIQSFKNIDEDIASNRDPTSSLAIAGLQLVVDGISGYGGGSSGGASKSVASEFGKTMTSGAEQSIQKSVRISAKEIVKMGGRQSSKTLTITTTAKRGLAIASNIGLTAAQRSALNSPEERERTEREEQESDTEYEQEREWREPREREEQERDSSYDQSENTQNNQSEQSETGSTSVSPPPPQPPQPPQGNRDNNENGTENKEQTVFENFLELLRKILNIVYGNIHEPFSSIFQELSKENRKYLKKVLKPLVVSGTLEVVIELVIRMFQQHFSQDISFLNFISLLEFIQTYVTEELHVRTLISNGTETEEAEMTPVERRERIIAEIASEEDIVQKLIELFEELKIEIEVETEGWNEQFPNFRDIFAAVYHYFKHRILPHDGRILSIREYYDWIREYLEEIEQTQTFTELRRSNQTYIHETFEPRFCRRFRIVLNCRGGRIVLSSAYVVTAMLPDDEENM